MSFVIHLANKLVEHDKSSEEAVDESGEWLHFQNDELKSSNDNDNFLLGDRQPY